MSVALSPECPRDLRHLVVADIAPAKGALSREFSGYVEALKKIEASRVTSRREAQDILLPYEQVRSRAFYWRCHAESDQNLGRDDACVLADELEEPGP